MTLSNHTLHLYLGVLSLLLLISCSPSRKISYTVPDGIRKEGIDFQWPDGSLVIKGVLLQPSSFEKIVIIVPDKSPGIRFLQSGLIDSLLAAGIAVLSYDERGTGESTGIFEEAGYFDLAADITLIARNLRRRFGPSIQIGSIGFGESGWKALIASHYDKRIEFLALIATPGLPGKDWVMQQVHQHPEDWQLKREKEDKTKKYMEDLTRILSERGSGQNIQSKMENYLSSIKVSKRKKKELRSSIFRSMVSTDPNQYIGQEMPLTLVVLPDNDPLFNNSAHRKAWELLLERSPAISSESFELGTDYKKDGRLPVPVYDRLISWIEELENRR